LPFRLNLKVEGRNDVMQRTGRNVFRSSVRTLAGLGLAAVLAMSGGCNNAVSGGLSGAGIGAGAGAIIGSIYGKAGNGAAIGAVTGAIGGAVLGDQNERRDRGPSQYGSYYAPSGYSAPYGSYTTTYYYGSYSSGHGSHGHCRPRCRH
jgi:osmotically inducible lipoprotein OsmB